MESETLKSVSCKICMHIFDEDQKCPRSLPCGHCFCHLCIETLIQASPICPLCNKKFIVNKPGELPICFPLIDTLHAYKKSVAENNRKINSDILDNDLGFCKEHKCPLQFRCMDCSYFVCGTCAMLHHKACRTLFHDDAVKEMRNTMIKDFENKVEENQSLTKEITIMENKATLCKQELENLKQELENLNQQLQELKNKRENNDKYLSDMKKRIMEASRNDLETKKSKLKSEINIETLKIRLELEGDGPMYAVEKSGEETLFGLVEVKDGTVRINSFISDEPPHPRITITFRQLLFSLTGSYELPGKTFFQFQGLEEDLIVKTDEDLAATPRVLNFLYITAGLKGPTYVNKTLEVLSEASFAFISCPWMKDGTKVEEAVVEGITDGGIYNSPDDRGSIYGLTANCELLSRFGIVLDFDAGHSMLNTKFGQVENGSHVLDQLYLKEDYLVLNCGFVID